MCIQAQLHYCLMMWHYLTHLIHTLQHTMTCSVGCTFVPSRESTTSNPDGYAIVLDLSHNDLLRLNSNTGLACSAVAPILLLWPC